MSVRFEIRLASVLLGGLAIVTSTLLYDRLSMLLNLLLVIGLFLAGLLQIVGATFEYRRVRQIGLIMSALGWMTLAAVFVTYWHLMLALVMCAASIVATWVYVQDVRKKPRGPCPFR